jgi:hypothetical protein
MTMADEQAQGILTQAIPDVRNPLWYVVPPPTARLVNIAFNYWVLSIGAANKYRILADVGPLKDQEIFVLKSFKARWTYVDSVINQAGSAPPAEWREVRKISAGYIVNPSGAYIAGGIYQNDPKAIYSPLIYPIGIENNYHDGTSWYRSVSWAENSFYGPMVFPPLSRPLFTLSPESAIGAGNDIGGIAAHLSGWVMPDIERIWRK